MATTIALATSAPRPYISYVHRLQTEATIKVYDAWPYENIVHRKRTGLVRKRQFFSRRNGTRNDGRRGRDFLTWAKIDHDGDELFMQPAAALKNVQGNKTNLQNQNSANSFQYERGRASRDEGHYAYQYSNIPVNTTTKSITWITIASKPKKSVERECTKE